MTIKEKIKVKAKVLFGENTDICTSLSETPKVFIGIVNKNGVVTKRITPTYMPKELLSFLEGIDFAKNKEV